MQLIFTPDTVADATKFAEFYKKWEFEQDGFFVYECPEQEYDDYYKSVIDSMEWLEISGKLKIGMP